MNPETLFFPVEIAHEIGLPANTINVMKSKGCKFYGRKTKIRWVREFIEKEAEGIPPVREQADDEESLEAAMRFEVEVEGRCYIWNLNAEFRELLEPIAAEFRWTVEDFLTRYSQGTLPGQIPKSFFDREEDGLPEPEELTVEFTSDPEVWERIRRAAKVCGETPRDFIWKTVWDSVRSAEDDMIISPGSGQIIGDELDIHEFLISRE